MSTVLADIATDGSLGPAIDFPGPNYTITADVGVQHGGNLFHSFSRFNIGAGENALFSGPASIARVISRVTGGQASWIDGSLDCDIAGADFYFVNPAGIMFGPNADLNVGASFFLSTADYIRLSDGGSFNAGDPGNSSLTTAPPAAFGFTGRTPGNISVQGYLSVSEGHNLTVVGGDIEVVAGKMEVSDGLIHIAATASRGEAFIDGLNVTSFDKLGTVSLSQESVVVGRGVSNAAVFIRGERFVIDHSTVGAVNNGGAAIGDVTIDLTGSLEISGSGAIGAVAYSDGKGGDIRVAAKSLSLSEGASLYTYAAGAGNAGNIRIKTDESICISGKNEAGSTSRLMSFSDGLGGSGDLDISTAALSLESGGRIINHHNNNGYRGSTSIRAETIVMDDNSNIMCGNLNLDTGTIDISGGAMIYGRPSLYDPSHPPILSINASQSLFITGEGENVRPWRNKTDPLYTGIHTDAFVFPNGVGGSIEISSPLIVVSESGQISTRTNTDYPAGTILIDTDKLILKGGGQIAADSNGSSLYEGPAGNIRVNASESIEISGSNGELWSGVFSTTRSDGNAGQLEIITPLLTISDNGRILVATGIFGDGDAGKIFLKTDMLQLLAEGGISAYSAGSGDEGRIEILAKDGILIRNGFIESNGNEDGAAGDIIIETASLNLIGGIITASVNSDGSRKGGNIIIDARDMTLESNSKIQALSRGWGDAGSIIFDTGTAFLSDSAITTETVGSDGGNISFSNETMMILNLVNSKITTTVAGGLGNGGNIDIDKPIFVILERSEIIANAFEGAGGNIHINTQQLIQDPKSRIDASSRKGINGRIDISSPDTDISGSITVLPGTFLDATAFMKNSCDVKTMGNTSSLVSTGLNGAQSAPEDPLLSLFYDSKNFISNSNKK